MKVAGLCCVMVGLVCTEVWAAPVAPIEFQVTQPDTGATLWLVPKGDEYANWVETVDGYTVVKEGKIWYYAQQNVNGRLVSSGLRPDALGKAAGPPFPQHLSPPVDPSAREKHILKPLAKGFTKSLSHTQNILTILVDFNDISFAYNDASFQTLMYGATDSVKEFYLENTYNNFTVQPAAESSGTANDGIVHVNAGVNHPNFGSTFNSWRGVVDDYISLANGSVNFADFDTDASGIVEPDELAIVLILAGYENSYGGDSALTPRVWGHKSGFSSALALDGKSIFEYTLFGERHAWDIPGSHQATIGIMCHELGHLMFGLPDLYDTDSSSSGIGEWGLMGGGSWNTFGGNLGNSPAHLSAWSKSVLDITTPDDILTTTNGVQVLKGDANASIKRLWIDYYRSSRREYFLVENRQQSGYDAGLPGSGLLIWHVDGSKTSNATDSHRLVHLEQADGLDNGTGGGDTGDPFPGSSSNTNFSGATTPNSNGYDNTANGISVTGISASAASMTASMSPRTSGYGDNISYDENGGNGYAYGYNQLTAWTALRVTNDTGMDTLDGFEVYIADSSATIDFRLYQSLAGTTPTTLIHSQNGFAGVSGWNRFLLDTPQAFPNGEDRIMVLKIVNSASGFPAAVDSSGSNSGRSHLDFDGSGAFESLPLDLNQTALLSLSAPAVPVADFSSASYSVNESAASVTITVNLDVPAAGGCSVQYATSSGTAVSPGDFTQTSGTLNFDSDDTSLTFAVPIVDDGTIEGSETFTVVLSNPTNCTLADVNSPAMVTITSNDTPQSIVYLNFAWTGGESGTLANPYNAFSEGLAGVLSGGTININGTSGATSSGYTGTLSTAVTLQASPAGTVRIGVTGAGH